MTDDNPASDNPASDNPASDAAMPLRVVVADDQASIREAVATMLDLMPDLEVVATAADGAQAARAVVEHRPDVVLMDLRMPVMDGIEATKAILARAPGTAVVVLTTFDDDDSILAALGAGARGYLTKEAGRADIARALHTAAAGQAVLDPRVQARLVAAAAARGAGGTDSRPDHSRADHDDLTRREREVLALIAAGLTNRQIASRLFVSDATVKTHINNLFAKARLRDRAQAVHYAFTNGLVDPPA